MIKKKDNAVASRNYKQRELISVEKARFLCSWK